MGPDQTAYWTHLRKCFLDYEKGYEERNRGGKEALKRCIEMGYLVREIEALKPSLIVAVGGEAKDFFSRYDKRLKGSLGELLFKRDEEGIFEDVRVCESTFTLIVVPHPSGLNRFWVNLYERYPNAQVVLNNIRERIKREILKFNPRWEE